MARYRQEGVLSGFRCLIYLKHHLTCVGGASDSVSSASSLAVDSFSALRADDTAATYSFIAQTFSIGLPLENGAA
jgi:hypothetical protein